MPDPRDVSVHTLLCKIVCALVDRPEFVVIKTQETEDGAMFTIHAHRDDIRKLMGKQGRNISSVRVLVKGVGMKFRRRYEVMIHDELVETGRYRGRLRAERLPASLRTPCELIAWARPESAQNDASLEQYANWFARWLVLCLPWDEDMQEAVLNEVASWARSDP